METMDNAPALAQVQQYNNDSLIETRPRMGYLNETTYTPSRTLDQLTQQSNLAYQQRLATTTNTQTQTTQPKGTGFLNFTTGLSSIFSSGAELVTAFKTPTQQQQQALPPQQPYQPYQGSGSGSGEGSDSGEGGKGGNKTIIIVAVIVLVVGAIGYFAFKS